MHGNLDLILRSMEASEELEARKEDWFNCVLGRSIRLKGGEAIRGKSNGEQENSSHPTGPCLDGARGPRSQNLPVANEMRGLW